MKIIKLTEVELNNLVAILTGEGRVSLSGHEAFEFVNIVQKIANAEDEVLEDVED